MVRSIGGLLACALLASSCSSLNDATGEPVPTTALSDEQLEVTSGPSAVQSGIAVPGGEPASIEAAEQSLGLEFGVVRIFARWNTGFPDAEHQSILDSGHTLHLSVRPRHDNGEVVMWRDLAAAQPGSDVYSEMEAWADQVVQLGPGHYFTLNHEPETRDSSGNGEADEFVDAWRAFTKILRERGGQDIKMTWVMTGGAFSNEKADLWYPGDEWVDVVGTDPYNWYLCQGTERDWRSFDDLVRPALDWAEAHGKPLVVPEFASASDKSDPARKAEWMRDAALTLNSPRYQSGVEYVSWFNVHDRGYPDCDWNYDTTPGTSQAFAEFMQSLSS